MFTLIAQNRHGEQLELTHNTAYDIKNIDGIDPPDAVMNVTHNAGYDGSVFNSSYIDNRTITITLAINYPAEENRINLYRFFQIKFPVRLYYHNASRDVYIDGYVQNFQIDYFKQKEVAQITVFCPLPAFNGVNEDIQEFTNIEPRFEFPVELPAAGIPFSEMIIDHEKSIINHGDIDTGVLISIRAIGTVVNPKIYNVDTGEYMIFNLSMSEGDEIIINTRQGQKSVKKISGGVTTNIIGNMQVGSSWFLLQAGDNIFTSTADSNPENMVIVFSIIDQFEGV